MCWKLRFCWENVYIFKTGKLLTDCQTARRTDRWAEIEIKTKEGSVTRQRVLEQHGEGWRGGIGVTEQQGAVCVGVETRRRCQLLLLPLPEQKPEKSNYVCLHSVSDFCHATPPRPPSSCHGLAALAGIVFAGSMCVFAWHTLGGAFRNVSSTCTRHICLVPSSTCRAVHHHHLHLCNASWNWRCGESTSCTWATHSTVSSL